MKKLMALLVQIYLLRGGALFVKQPLQFNAPWCRPLRYDLDLSLLLWSRPFAFA
jgi:hypothetical protein